MVYKCVNEIMCLKFVQLKTIALIFFKVFVWEPENIYCTKYRIGMIYRVHFNSMSNDL